MRLSARNVMRTRQESRRLGGFGKQWKSGDTLQVFYPIYWNKDDKRWDLMVANVWGHSINPKEVSLKRIFAPTLSEIVDGRPVTPDVLYQFSRIAPLFLQGAYDSEVAKLESKNLNKSALNSAMKKLEKDYQIEDGRIRKDPAVGKLRLIISTECVTVPLNDGKPDVENARLVSQDLSDTKIQALYAILTTPKYGLGEPTEEDMQPDAVKWLEVTYTFGTTNDRKQDGRVSPVGVTPEYRLQKTHEELFPRIKQQLNQLPTRTETIVKRNSSYHPVDESAIFSALSTYCALKSDYLDALAEEGMIERLAKNVEIIDKIQIPIQNAEINAKLEEARSELETKQAAVTTAGGISPDSSVNDLTGAPSVAEAIDEDDIKSARDGSEDDDDNQSKLEDFEMGGLAAAGN